MNSTSVRLQLGTHLQLLKSYNDFFKDNKMGNILYPLIVLHRKKMATELLNQLDKKLIDSLLENELIEVRSNYFSFISLNNESIDKIKMLLKINNDYKKDFSINLVEIDHLIRNSSTTYDKLSSNLVNVSPYIDSHDSRAMIIMTDQLMMLEKLEKFIDLQDDENPMSYDALMEIKEKLLYGLSIHVKKKNDKKIMTEQELLLIEQNLKNIEIGKIKKELFGFNKYLNKIYDISVKNVSKNALEEMKKR